MNFENKLAVSLFLLRVSIFVVMFVWTIDKLVRPAHASAVYETFYFLGGLQNMVIYVIGLVELGIIVAFLFGLWKTFTYGLVLIFHAISTLASYQHYIFLFEGVNLLFFAAWPMLAACMTLFLLREKDTFLSI